MAASKQGGLDSSPRTMVSHRGGFVECLLSLISFSRQEVQDLKDLEVVHFSSRGDNALGCVVVCKGSLEPPVGRERKD